MEAELFSQNESEACREVIERLRRKVKKYWAPGTSDIMLQYVLVALAWL